MCPLVAGLLYTYQVMLKLILGYFDTNAQYASSYGLGGVVGTVAPHAISI